MAYNKTVWENLPSTNTPLNETNLNKIEDELEELDGGYIVDSGSNSNGIYIKFSDGTMICYGVISKTFALNIAYGNVYRSDEQTITLPQTFSNTNYVVQLQMNAPTHLGYTTAKNTNNLKFIPIGFVQQTSRSMTIDYCVIGRWQ